MKTSTVLNLYDFLFSVKQKLYFLKKVFIVYTSFWTPLTFIVWTKAVLAFVKISPFVFFRKKESHTGLEWHGLCLASQISQKGPEHTCNWHLV